MNCLGEYRRESVLTFVAAKLEQFERLGAMIGEAAMDHTLSVGARICELEVLKAQIEHNITVLQKTDRRKRRK